MLYLPKSLALEKSLFGAYETSEDRYLPYIDVLVRNKKNIFQWTCK